MAFSLFNRGKKNQPATNQVVEVDVTKITPNRFQPRKVFDPTAIKELAETIEAHGLLQPIILREYEDDKYEIIAGERRFRAVNELQWEKVPAIVEKMNDKETASLALIENLQREQLSSVEEAQAYRDLMELNHITQTALAKGMGKSQSFVANKLRLLKLIAPVQNAILDRRITERHGRAMLDLDEDQQRDVLMQIVNDKLNVKQTEELVGRMLGKIPAADETPAVEAPKKKAKKKKQRVSQKVSDSRIAVNTIKQSIKMIQDSGMVITTREEEQDDHYEIVIEIPKNKQEKGGK